MTRREGNRHSEGCDLLGNHQRTWDDYKWTFLDNDELWALNKNNKWQIPRYHGGDLLLNLNPGA